MKTFPAVSSSCSSVRYSLISSRKRLRETPKFLAHCSTEVMPPLLIAPSNVFRFSLKYRLCSCKVTDLFLGICLCRVRGSQEGHQTQRLLGRISGTEIMYGESKDTVMMTDVTKYHRLFKIQLFGLSMANTLDSRKWAAISEGIKLKIPSVMVVPHC